MTLHIYICIMIKNSRIQHPSTVLKWLPRWSQGYMETRYSCKRYLSTANNCNMLALTENFTAPLKRRITIVKPRIAQQQRQVGVQTVKTATGTWLHKYVASVGECAWSPRWDSSPIDKPMHVPTIGKKNICINIVHFPLHTYGEQVHPGSVGTMWNHHRVFSKVNQGLGKTLGGKLDSEIARESC